MRPVAATGAPFRSTHRLRSKTDKPCFGGATSVRRRTGVDVVRQRDVVVGAYRRHRVAKRLEPLPRPPYPIPDFRRCRREEIAAQDLDQDYRTIASNRIHGAVEDCVFVALDIDLEY